MQRLIKRFHLLPLLIIIGGLAIASVLVATPNTAKKKKAPQSSGLLVRTTSIAPGDYITKVEAMGQVEASQQIELKARVSGAVVEVAEGYIPGGYFKEGEPMLYVDREDYELALETERANYRQAKAELDLEMGRQDIARDELEILSKVLGKPLEESDLALRKPQLAQTKAALQIAKARLDAARLNMERTVIRAPFNSLITERITTLGDTVSPQDTLATLVSTDMYWVSLSVPINKLAWLSSAGQVADQEASRATIYLQQGTANNATREGYLLRIVGTLDTRSRLANVLVAVPDPLLMEGEKPQRPAQPLIVGDFVKVVIEGNMVENVFRIPLNLIRDNNQLWLMRDGKLAIEDVDIAYEDRNYAYVKSGINANDLVVTSDIMVPINGMVLQSETKAPTPEVADTTPINADVADDEATDDSRNPDKVN